MRIPIVRHGDPTTTGGNVAAYSSTMHDNNKKLALHGDEATCGNCDGLWNIVGTGEGMGENGRLVVINGDHVACPCGSNRVIAGEDAGCFIHVLHDRENTDAVDGAKVTRRSADQSAFDQSFVLRDEKTQKPLAGVLYMIVTEDGTSYEDRTDTQGRTISVCGNQANTATIHVIEEIPLIHPEWDKYL